jgi:DNA-binding transcriptional regulator WhiA
MSPIKRNPKKINLNTAELFGALIGDGCLSAYYCNYDKRHRFVFLLTGHKHDEPYYRETIRPIVMQEFKVNGCIQIRKKSNAVIFVTSAKNIFDFFSGFDFPVGRKTLLSLPNAIMQDNLLSVACLRGIFDTDGSIYKRYSKKYQTHSKLYNYNVIQIKLNSFNIIQQIKCILVANSISSNKIISSENSYVIRVTRQTDVNKFMQLVNPHNKYHIERYLNRC